MDRKGENNYDLLSMECGSWWGSGTPGVTGAGGCGVVQIWDEGESNEGSFNGTVLPTEKADFFM